MKIVLLAAGLACTFMACQSSSQNNAENNDSSGMNTNAPMQDTGWISLFDGNDLNGWHTYGKATAGSAWNVDSNSIHLNASAKNGYQSEGGGDLVSDEEFGDFDLKLDWKISKGGNSGILIYVKEDTSQYKETWYTGPEIQVLDNEGHPDAKIIKHRAGDLYDLITGTPETVKPYGEWNNVEIKSQNGQLDVWLNGEHTISTPMWDDNWKKMIAGSKFKDMPDFGTFKTGHLDLQDHGFDVWFKNIMIKKL